MEIPALLLIPEAIAFLAGVFIILVFAWIGALIMDKKHREKDKVAFPGTCPPGTENEPFIVFTEMYDIWVGRIIEIPLRVLGRKTRRIDAEHCLSVWLWILVAAAAAGFLRGWFGQDILECILGSMIIGTFLYAHWRHDEYPSPEGGF